MLMNQLFFFQFWNVNKSLFRLFWKIWSRGSTFSAAGSRGSLFSAAGSRCSTFSATGSRGSPRYNCKHYLGQLLPTYSEHFAYVFEQWAKFAACCNLTIPRVARSHKWRQTVAALCFFQIHPHGHVALYFFKSILTVLLHYDAFLIAIPKILKNMMLTNRWLFPTLGC